MQLSPLPARSRLLHVGLTKTGTTALQNVASSRREQLLEHGVRYPGRRYNHRQAAFALYRRGSAGSDPRPDAWDELQTELAGDPRSRVLISNEFIAGWEDEVAARFVDQLGPRTHVVITVRNFGALLPSIWQQYVRSGYPGGFEDFLGIVLGGSAGSAPPPPNLDRHDQGAVVARWARVAGAERVFVVVADKNRPSLIPQAVEGLLDLPPGMLYDPAQRGAGTNRSLSRSEVAVLLEVNRILAVYGADGADLVRIARRAAGSRFLDRNPAPAAVDTLSLPPWAAAAAAARGQEFADAIAVTGVAVIGDLEELTRVPDTGQGTWTTPDTVPIDVAAEALVAAVSAAIGRGPDFSRPRAAGGSGPGGRPGRRTLLLPAPTRRWWRAVRRIPTRLRSGAGRRISSLR